MPLSMANLVGLAPLLFTCVLVSSLFVGIEAQTNTTELNLRPARAAQPNSALATTGYAGPRYVGPQPDPLYRSVPMVNNGRPPFYKPRPFSATNLLRPNSLRPTRRPLHFRPPIAMARANPSPAPAMNATSSNVTLASAVADTPPSLGLNSTSTPLEASEVSAPSSSPAASSSTDSSTLMSATGAVDTRELNGPADAQPAATGAADALEPTSRPALATEAPNPTTLSPATN